MEPDPSLTAAYVREKLGNAVRALATKSGDIRARLEMAFMEFHTLKPADFPDDLGKTFAAIVDDLSFIGPAPARGGAVARPLLRTSVEDAELIARRILALYVDAIEWGHRIETGGSGGAA